MEAADSIVALAIFVDGIDMTGAILSFNLWYKW